jgi:hypothetical protein
MSEIIEKFGLPREYCSCPSCNQIYGHHRTKVCKNCSECSKCCTCHRKDLIGGEEMVQWIVETT